MMDTLALAEAATRAALSTFAKGGDNLAIFEAIKAAIEKICGPKAIEDNQVLPAPMRLKLEDSVLEPQAGVDDLYEYSGPVVTIAPYKPPKDKRVQGLLKAAASARAAKQSASEPITTFTDPRLDPDFGKKKPKK